jgi:ACT domain-containing protein
MPINEKKLENLRKANAQSHQLIVDSLRDALYQMLETREVSEIKVVDLIKVAGISRGAFYRHYYLITDVLTDDIQTITTDVQKAMGADIGMNWDIILQTVYRHKKKIPLLLKAGMGMEILNNINRSLDNVSEEYKLKTLAWNGIIFNAILYWANRGFENPIDVLAAQLTELTKSLYDSDFAATFDPGAKQKA